MKLGQETLKLFAVPTSKPTTYFVNLPNQTPLMPAPRPKLTHFLCLPLVNSASHPQWQTSLKQLIDNVKAANVPGITSDVIRPLSTLHITIGVLSLLTPELEQAARALLHGNEVDRVLRELLKPIKSNDTMEKLPTDAKPQPIPFPPPPLLPGRATDSNSSATAALAAVSNTSPEPPPPLTTSFYGLQAMRSPTSTTVLFVSPTDPDSRIHHLCISLQRLFQAANLLVPDNRPLTLHATIINTIYASSSSKSKSIMSEGSRQAGGNTKNGKKRKNSRLTFDATELLERFTGFEWVRDFNLEKVSLCKMGARKTIENGVVVDEVYEEVDCVPLSSSH